MVDFLLGLSNQDQYSWSAVLEISNIRGPLWSLFQTHVLLNYTSTASALVHATRSDGLHLQVQLRQ
jgi:hypothetical protein